MGAIEAKAILERAYCKRHDCGATVWDLCDDIQEAIDALDMPEAWNFGEPPEPFNDCWVLVRYQDAYRVVGMCYWNRGVWFGLRPGCIQSDVLAWQYTSIPAPPTAAEIEAARKKQGQP